jgi:hypothetical protein
MYVKYSVQCMAHGWHLINCVTVGELGWHSSSCHCFHVPGTQKLLNSIGSWNKWSLMLLLAKQPFISGWRWSIMKMSLLLKVYFAWTSKIKYSQSSCAYCKSLLSISEKLVITIIWLPNSSNMSDNITKIYQAFGPDLNFAWWHVSLFWFQMKIYLYFRWSKWGCPVH